ncbi:phospholipid carrier-dependent glycosyltransferase [Candidatus Binatus soli]|jgi:dolichyl-phosphate-mannose--protein O-mannosyl transferase|uniref:phospholipid carrier-dependent glycosyltransferase n=1 Tax=Candidatus Binatus soli TaxID=1953413 RepID=UPI003D103C9E
MIDSSPPPRWRRRDSAAIGALLIAALATRLWHFWLPPVLIFDEKDIVEQARNYLLGLPFKAVHPPLSSLLVASSMKVLGVNAVAWRLPSVLFGTALVGITYLLGRRICGSRIAAGLAAGFVICDGLFIVDSRTALWEIFYLTFAACAYLALFTFMQSRSKSIQRRALALMGVALGLGLASKLLIPAVTFALVMAFVFGALLSESWSSPRTQTPAKAQGSVLILDLASALALVGGLSALVYFVVFIPNYWFGWWRGVGDQLAYYHQEFRYQIWLQTSGHPYASRWWSWPLMLRSILYWRDDRFFPDSPVLAIRALGNPVIWWGVLVSVPLAALKAIARRDAAMAFVVVGYAGYLAMWIPISRYQFVYYYMPSLYLGFFALASTVVECAGGEPGSWEPVALLTPVIAALVLGAGAPYGLGIAAALAGAYLGLRYYSPRHAGMFVSIVFVTTVFALSVYFFPLWTGAPLSPAGFQQRMWLHGPGLANWI